MRLRGDLEAAEKVATGGLRRAPGLRALHHRGRLLRDRRDPPPARRLRFRRGGVRAGERARGRPPAGPSHCSTLRKGSLEAAVAGITRALDEVEEPLSRIRRLPAQVEIAVAARDLKTARGAVAELEELVDSYKFGSRRAPAFDATVHVAAGRIALAEGDTDEAIRLLRHARDEWRGVGAPSRPRTGSRAARGRVPPERRRARRDRRARRCTCSLRAHRREGGCGACC